LSDVQKEADTNRQYIQHIKLAQEAYNQDNLEVARDEYQKASVLKPSEPIPLAKIAEIDKKMTQLDEAEKLAAMEQAQKLAKEKADKELYAKAIAAGDKAFTEKEYKGARTQYISALTVLPNEKYPKSQIAKIDEIEDQIQLLARQDAEYKRVIKIADDLFAKSNMEQALAQYRTAATIKPEESYPQNQMALIDKLMNEAQPVETYSSNLPEPETVKTTSKPIFNPAESAQDTEARAKNFTTTNTYEEAIKKADDSFGIKDYSVARFYYLKANELKPTDEYPKNQIELIRKLIDSQLSANDVSGYENAIAQADAAFAKASYNVAKFFYYKALEIKSWEKYPKDRINEILALTHSLLSEKEEKEYRDMIAKADEAYFNKDIAIARFYYNRAISIKRDENYPKIKLRDIQQVIDQENQDQQNIEYNRLIELADQALQLENYSIARFNYNKALNLKQDEQYPKDQLKRIKEALEKQKN